ncbi:MAG TPA: hypothetical protein PLI97_07805 [Fluviicola sp.]|nr:hypothetical protein [Fluviicola sp.]
MKQNYFFKAILIISSVFFTSFKLYSQANILPASGNVGIGTTTPTERLTVNGSAKIDSTLTVRDSVVFKKNLRVEQDVRFLGETKTQKLRVNDDFVSMNLAKFNGDVKLTNLSTPNPNNYNNFSFLMTNSNGLIKKTDTEALSTYLKQLMYSTPATPTPLGLCDLFGYTDNPFWANAPQKLFSECPSVFVGIGTKTPSHLLSVAGNAKFDGNLWSHKSLSIGADNNSFSKLFIKNDNRNSSLHINQDGNTINYSKLIFLEFSEPTTEVIKVQNTALNYTPFLLNANGSMYIKNDQGKIADFDQDGRFTLYHNGVQTFRVETNGMIRGRRLKIDLDTWADYVFDANYQLMPLHQLENYIKTEKHLPNVPSEKDLIHDGLDVVEINRILMEKVEELTLYIIQQNKNTESLKLQIEALNIKLQTLEQSH